MANVELVIEIPEKTYKHILSTQFYIPGPRSGKSLLEEILKAIRTGVSLPKGHGRLIDADALNEAYTYECISECDRCEHCSKDGHGCELLLNAPTILEAKEQDTASGGDYNLQNVPLSDIDEATERFKEKLGEGCFNDKELSDEEIQTMLQALVDADKEQSE